jgi:hypothetical protein
MRETVTIAARGKPIQGFANSVEHRRYQRPGPAINIRRRQIAIRRFAMMLSDELVTEDSMQLVRALVREVHGDHLLNL